jgi:hypothetical protein
MTTYTIKRGDTAPSPRAQLLDGTGSPVNLTGAAARFKARASEGDPLKVDAVAVVEAGTNGWVRYDPISADTDTVADYLAEWQVTFGSGAVETWPGEGHDTFRVTADLDAPISTGGWNYASRDEARNAGAQGTDDQIDDALASARARIDSYTGQSWAPEEMTVVAPLSGSGVALLPRQIDPDLPVEVRFVGATTDVPATAYHVTSSRVLGQVDAIYLGAGGGDILIAGAEPYNGGWANLLPRSGQIQVTGTFGVLDTPAEVSGAAALIAAAISQGGGLPADYTSGATVDDEGNTVAIEPSGTTDDGATRRPTRTTGVPAADALLAPLKRRPIRLT